MRLEDVTAMVVFARVVDLGGFSAAAQALGLSKSAVSKQISKLEDRLGTRLLNRTTRQLSLTEAGAAFFERCQRVEAEALAAEEAVTHLAEAPRGLLKVNSALSFGVRHIAPALPAFLAMCPELEVDLSLNDRPVDLVEEGYDLAIRIGKLDDSSLVARRLAPMRRFLFAAPDYLARAGRPEHPNDLKQHDCLLYAYQTSDQTWSFKAATGEAERDVKVRISGRLRINNGDAILEACIAGQGIALLPSFICSDALTEGAVERLLPDWADGTPGGVHAVFPASRNLSPKVRVFVDFLLSRFGSEPYWDAPLRD
ncbi:LysR family transcriptional regulator [Algihabitans albus]|uniref:LysR family transcriptional regulator n=1 Tax=Algihabitans albus TaxID=2164067 RepID=UPI000E5D2206|nr:LysR family transcriptional regulator [Algihabitans albus]